MPENLHKALAKIVPHVDDGCQIFIHENGTYHKFRVVEREICHTESHSGEHVEKGRGKLAVDNVPRPRGLHRQMSYL